MTYQNNDLISAIMQVQEFLRTIQIFESKTVSVPIDGIYGDATANAVKAFQKQNELPVTGRVDKSTYDKLYQKALEAEFEMSEPLPIYVFANGRSIYKGEKSSFVMLLQMLLNELKIAYDSYEVLKEDGVFGTSTENAIKEFQRKNGLISSGIVNKKTWNALVENYNKYKSTDV